MTLSVTSKQRENWSFPFSAFFPLDSPPHDQLWIDEKQEYGCQSEYYISLESEVDSIVKEMLS